MLNILLVHFHIDIREGFFLMSDPVDKSELTAKERRQIESVAKVAGNTARLSRAQELLPFEDLRPRARSVASWLLTLDKFVAHYKQWMEGRESKQYPADNIYVMKRGEVIVGTIGANTINDLDDFVRGVALTLCGYSDTDEIRELRVLPWMVRISSSRDPRLRIAEKRTFTHKPTPRDRLLSREVVDVTTAVRNRIGRNGNGNDNDDLDIENGPSIMEVVKKLGHQKELDRTYHDAYTEKFEELEEAMLNDPVRNAEIDKKNGRKETRRALVQRGSRFMKKD